MFKVGQDLNMHVKTEPLLEQFSNSLIIISKVFHCYKLQFEVVTKKKFIKKLTYQQNWFFFLSLNIDLQAVEK